MHAANPAPPTPTSPRQLFLGDTNRVVAETPLNQASSRSHCVFTLHLEARRAGEAVVRRSKLHFVDLAGSERVGKTGLVGHAQLREAKYINLSLHYLEQVWVGGWMGGRVGGALKGGVGMGVRVGTAAHCLMRRGLLW